ncbi:MerR family transcriptional regulator [Microbulbifer echini]|uniref:MerR family transcriptional regulator n=1 Tax=Microbulbifer echini TaxID=1529067 RepID=A0ABV4NP40_9GAMM|nr:MerR family transcriptional regulator [uncultured Microbulbifer sp.]
MNISQAAQQSGLSSKALRHYESTGLLVPARRANGYRDYSEANLEALRFIQRARASGFSVDEVRSLLELRDNPGRRSRVTQQLVREKLSRLEAQLRDMLEMRASLASFVDSCAGDDSPRCAILEQLSGQPCE